MRSTGIDFKEQLFAAAGNEVTGFSTRDNIIILYLKSFEP